MHITQVDQEWLDDQDERYCYCNKPYYGKMICCDSPTCEKQWFHYECARITEAPEGAWYCNDCIKKNKKW